MNGKIDYLSVEASENKSPADYHYTERCAAILSDILEAGTPEALSRTEAVNHYNVDPSTITRDIQTVGDFVAEQLGSNAALRTRAAYHRALEIMWDAAEDGDWRATRAAVSTIDKWNQWFADTGHQRRVPDQVNISGEMDFSPPTDVYPTEHTGIHELSETEHEHLDCLSSTAEASTVATRVDADGDDMSARDLGLAEEC